MFTGVYLYDGEELKDSLGEEKKLSPYKLTKLLEPSSCQGFKCMALKFENSTLFLFYDYLLFL